MRRIPAGNATEGTVTVEIVTLSVASGDANGEFVVSSAPDDFSVTVIEPAAYAGEYDVQIAQLTEGPVNLVPPQISGTATTLTLLPGLWAFDDAAPLTVARQWMRGTTPIEGATGESYTVVADDAAQTLSVVETASTSAGTREAASLGLDIPAASKGVWSPTGLPGLAVWLDPSDAATVTLSGNEVTALADKSGNGRDAAVVASYPAPTLEATLDGKPVLRFPTGGILRCRQCRSCRDCQGCRASPSSR